MNHRAGKTVFAQSHRGLEYRRPVAVGVVTFKRRRICRLFTTAERSLRGRDKFGGKAAAGARNTVRIGKIPNESSRRTLCSWSRHFWARSSELCRGCRSRAVAKTWFRVSNEPRIPYALQGIVPPSSNLRPFAITYTYNCTEAVRIARSIRSPVRVPSAQVFAKLLLFLQSSSRVNNADRTAPSEVYGHRLTPLLRLEKLSCSVYRFLGNACIVYTFVLRYDLREILGYLLAVIEKHYYKPIWIRPCSLATRARYQRTNSFRIFFVQLSLTLRVLWTHIGVCRKLSKD